ncbi:MAG: hypothetical protein ACFCU9_05625 [Cyanophyceae cyanobacterium]
MADAADLQNRCEKIDREITRANQILSRCKLRRDKSSLALRGRFPPKSLSTLNPQDELLAGKRQHLYLGLQATPAPKRLNQPWAWSRSHYHSLWV